MLVVAHLQAGQFPLSMRIEIEDISSPVRHKAGPIQRLAAQRTSERGVDHGVAHRQTQLPTMARRPEASSRFPTFAFHGTRRRPSRSRYRNAGELRIRRPVLRFTFLPIPTRCIVRSSAFRFLFPTLDLPRRITAGGPRTRPGVRLEPFPRFFQITQQLHQQVVFPPCRQHRQLLLIELLKIKVAQVHSLPSSTPSPLG
jgi:hypothetical protein